MLLVIVQADGEDFQSQQAVPHAVAVFWLCWPDVPECVALPLFTYSRFSPVHLVLVLSRKLTSACNTCLLLQGFGFGFAEI